MKRSCFSEEQIISILKEREAGVPVAELSQARAPLGRWRSDYNGSSPHSALGWQTPSAFVATFHLRRDLPLRQAKSSAKDSAAHPADKLITKLQNNLNAG